jgi:phosphate-selective porin OprO and OprP
MGVFMTKNAIFRTAALAALAAAASIGGAGKADAQAVTAWAGAPRTTEEDRQFKVNGRVQYDVYSVDADFTTGTDQKYSGAFARRVFLGAEGRFTQNWRYNIKFDLTPGRQNNVTTTGSPVTAVSGSNVGDEVRLDDFYLEYAGSTYSVFVGQNNSLHHIEDRTSSNETPFNERSAVDQAFGFGKIFGISYLTNGGNWSAGVGVETDKLDNPENPVDEETIAYMGRATFAPYYERTPDGASFLHLGLSARYRDNGSGATTLGYSATSGSASSAAGFLAPVNAGFAGGHDALVGGEVFFQKNTVGIGGEYMYLKSTGALGVERAFQGGYAEAWWSPTGEGRNYVASDGSWGRITPLRTLGSDGGIGSILLQARYDWLDLDDLTTLGGEQRGWTAAATWKPIAYVKFQANYTNYDIDRKTALGVPVASADGNVQAVSLRTQFDF